MSKKGVIWKNVGLIKEEGKKDKTILSHARHISKKTYGVLRILFTQRQAIKQNINYLKDIKMLFSPRSVQNS